MAKVNTYEVTIEAKNGKETRKLFDAEEFSGAVEKATRYLASYWTDWKIISISLRYEGEEE